MTNAIAFPGLSIGTFYIKEYFSFFGLKIHYYGLIIAIGILAGFFTANSQAKKHGITTDNLLDVVIFGLPSAVIFARIYYVIFELERYKDNLIDVFKIWEGGIAIYGAIIGACISTLVYCKVKKIPVFNMFDAAIFGLPVGQAIGRWGNFVNAEAYGGATSLPWRMELGDIGISVHPTFLYESLWNVLVIIFLLQYQKKQKFDGEIFFAYIAAYGLGRLFIEGIRTDSLYLGPVRVSQIVAAVCILVGVVTIIIKRRKASVINND